MFDIDRTRLTAIIATAIVAIFIVAILLLCHLGIDASIIKERPTTELIEVDEEFVEFLDQSTTPSTPLPAYTPEPKQNRSEAAPATGTDRRDQGKAAPPKPDVTANKPSPVKATKKDVPEKTGPTKEELEQQEASRRARQGIADAFKTSDNAKDNTTSSGTKPGDSGKPSGSDSAVDGSGTGSVGGGWIMPAYPKVPSTLTGRIELRATVGPDGRVIDVKQTGGKAPAGSDAKLVAKCIAEVKARRFTRTDGSDAPQSAIARIIYTFK